MAVRQPYVQRAYPGSGAGREPGCGVGVGACGTAGSKRLPGGVCDRAGAADARLHGGRADLARRQLHVSLGVMGLMMAASKGAGVPASAIESLTQHLIGSLRGLSDATSAQILESHARSLLVLSLPGQPQPAYMNWMVDKIQLLTPAARSMLAAAIAHGRRFIGTELKPAYFRQAIRNLDLAESEGAAGDLVSRMVAAE